MLSRYRYLLFSVLLGLGCMLGTGASWAITPEAAKLYDQGIAFYNNGQAPQAIEAFNKATQLSPDFSDAFYNLGTVYYQQAQYEAAQRSFQRVLGLNPQDTQARFSLGLALEKRLQYTSAIQELSQIPTADTRYTQAQTKIADLSQKINKSLPQNGATQNGVTMAAVANKSAAAAATKPATATTSSTPTTAKPATTAATTPVVKATPTVFASGFSGPTGLVLGKDGNLYVANYSKNMIMQVTPAGTKKVFVQGEGLSGPIGMVGDSRNGNLYVANYLQNNVIRITPQGQITEVAKGLKKPYMLYLDTAQNSLFVSEQETNAVSRFKL